MNDSPITCAVCLLHQEQTAIHRWEIARDALWVLRHHPDPAPLLGWLLLDTRRHCGGPAEFTEAEAAGWGPAVQRASQLVRQLTGCDRVYAMAFGEGARHLHLHLIPRFGLEPATAAWSVADLYRSVVAGDTPAAESAGVRAFVEQARLQGLGV
jgi:diadenosine tetraphosphate (Ap4A) HIT family hydrolase